jgi:hypothetical protein
MRSEGIEPPTLRTGISRSTPELTPHPALYTQIDYITALGWWVSCVSRFRIGCRACFRLRMLNVWLYVWVQCHYPFCMFRNTLEWATSSAVGPIVLRLARCAMSCAVRCVDVVTSSLIVLIYEATGVRYCIDFRRMFPSSGCVRFLAANMDDFRLVARLAVDKTELMRLQKEFGRVTSRAADSLITKDQFDVALQAVGFHDAGSLNRWCWQIGPFCCILILMSMVDKEIMNRIFILLDRGADYRIQYRVRQC